MRFLFFIAGFLFFGSVTATTYQSEVNSCIMDSLCTSDDSLSHKAVSQVVQGCSYMSLLTTNDSNGSTNNLGTFIGVSGRRSGLVKVAFQKGKNSISTSVFNCAEYNKKKNCDEPSPYVEVIEAVNSKLDCRFGFEPKEDGSGCKRTCKDGEGLVMVPSFTPRNRKEFNPYVTARKAIEPEGKPLFNCKKCPEGHISQKNTGFCIDSSTFCTGPNQYIIRRDGEDTCSFAQDGYIPNGDGPPRKICGIDEFYNDDTRKNNSKMASIRADQVDVESEALKCKSCPQGQTTMDPSGYDSNTCRPIGECQEGHEWVSHRSICLPTCPDGMSRQSSGQCGSTSCNLCDQSDSKIENLTLSSYPLNEMCDQQAANSLIEKEKRLFREASVSRKKQCEEEINTQGFSTSCLYDDGAVARSIKSKLFGKLKCLEAKDMFRDKERLRKSPTPGIDDLKNRKSVSN